MLRLLKVRAQLKRKAGELYGVIVTQARNPEFYAKLGVPDTPVGRYELVVLHLFLVMERLGDEPGAGNLGRALVEAFVVDMDDSLREMGTGDVAVAKKVRRAAAGFYERSQDYRLAVRAGEPQKLGTTLAMHIMPGGTQKGLQSDALAGYVTLAGASLAAQNGADVLDGRITFPVIAIAAEDVR